MIKKLSIEERKAIKKHLVHGDIKRLAKKLNLSQSTIHSFFNGRSNNPYILEELIILLNKYDSNTKDFVACLNKK